MDTTDNSAAVEEFFHPNKQDFLKEEYKYLLAFLIVFSVVLIFVAEPVLWTFYTTAAFMVGGLTSIVAGYIGIRIAVYTNVRTAKECAQDIGLGFNVAYRGGQVLGFVLVGMALFVLQLLVIAYIKLYMDDKYVSKVKG